MPIAMAEEVYITVIGEETLRVVFREDHVTKPTDILAPIPPPCSGVIVMSIVASQCGIHPNKQVIFNPGGQLVNRLSDPTQLNLADFRTAAGPSSGGGLEIVGDISPRPSRQQRITAPRVCLGNRLKNNQEYRAYPYVLSHILTNKDNIVVLPLTTTGIKGLPECTNCQHKTYELAELTKILCPLPQLSSAALHDSQIAAIRTSLASGQKYSAGVSHFLDRATCCFDEVIVTYTIPMVAGMIDFVELFELGATSDDECVAACVLFNTNAFTQETRVHTTPRLSKNNLDSIISKGNIDRKKTPVLKYVMFLLFVNDLPFLIYVNNYRTVRIYHWGKMIDTHHSLLATTADELPRVLERVMDTFIEAFRSRTDMSQWGGQFLFQLKNYFTCDNIRYDYRIGETSLLNANNIGLIRDLGAWAEQEYLVKSFHIQAGRYGRVDFHVTVGEAIVTQNRITYLSSHKTKRDAITDMLIFPDRQNEIYWTGKKMEIHCNNGYLIVDLTWHSLQNLVVINRLIAALSNRMYEMHWNKIPIFSLDSFQPQIEQLTKIDPMRYLVGFRSPYSVHCQADRQPRQINVNEYELILSSGIDVSQYQFTLYENATTKKPHYYVCGPKYQQLSFIVSVNPRNLGVPCCALRVAKDNSVRSIIMDLFMQNQVVTRTDLFQAKAASTKSIQNAHLIKPDKNIEPQKFYAFGSTILSTYMNHESNLAMTSLSRPQTTTITIWPLELMATILTIDIVEVLNQLVDSISQLSNSEIRSQLHDFGLILHENGNPHRELKAIVEQHRMAIHGEQLNLESVANTLHYLRILLWLIHHHYRVFILRVHFNNIQPLLLYELLALAAIAENTTSAPRLALAILMPGQNIYCLGCHWKARQEVSYFFNGPLYTKNLLQEIMSTSYYRQQGELIQYLENKGVSVEAAYVGMGNIIYGLQVKFGRERGFLPVSPTALSVSVDIIKEVPKPNTYFSVNTIAQLWPIIARRLPIVIYVSPVDNRIMLIEGEELRVPVRHGCYKIPSEWQNVDLFVQPESTCPLWDKNVPPATFSDVLERLRTHVVGLRLSLHDRAITELSAYINSFVDDELRTRMLQDYDAGVLHLTVRTSCRFPDDLADILRILDHVSFPDLFAETRYRFDAYAGFMTLHTMSYADRLVWIGQFIDNIFITVTDYTRRPEEPFRITATDAKQLVHMLAAMFNFKCMFGRFLESSLNLFRLQYNSQMTLLLNTWQV